MKPLSSHNYPLQEISSLRKYNSKTFPTKNTKERVTILPFGGRFKSWYGEVLSEIHIKPIHYIGNDKKWHNLSEIASYFGNRNGMILKEGWENKADFGYLAWYLKRQKLIKGKGIFLPKHTGVLPMPLLLNTTSTFYPDPDPESTTVDGVVLRINDGGTWADIRGGAGTNVVDSGTDNELDNMETGSGSNWRKIHRGVMLFDTGPTIPDTDSITSATFSLYGPATAKENTNSATAAQAALHIVSSAPASNTALATGDYAIASWGTTSFGSFVYADYASGAYNDVALNASGLSNISKTGVSKFGVRSGGDLNDSEPTRNGGSLTTYIAGVLADTALQDKDPKLVVVHGAAAVAGMNRMPLLGLG